MIYAQIKNCVVQNVIQLDDESIVHLFEVGFDHCVRVDHLTPQPGIGWFHDGQKFMKLIRQEPTGGIPNEVPHGDATTFEPFLFSEASDGFEVSVEGHILKIGCHQYDYVWTRYALWMILEKGHARVGPLIKTEKGMSYGRYFDITLSDIKRLYLNLCTLK